MNAQERFVFNHPRLSAFIRGQLAVPWCPSLPSMNPRASSATMELSPHHKLMKFGVIVFPGSNCDHDAFYAVSHNLGQKAEFIWHDSSTLGDVDAVILPGGFAYGDYLRCGAIAKFSPVMAAVRQFAAAGGLVMGICNGFQILVEAGLLPGALSAIAASSSSAAKSACIPKPPIRRSPTPCIRGRCSAFPSRTAKAATSPTEQTLDEFVREDRILFRYLGNPNGSLQDIAGILTASAT